MSRTDEAFAPYRLYATTHQVPELADAGAALIASGIATPEQAAAFENEMLDRCAERLMTADRARREKRERRRGLARILNLGQ
jgi:hypothetical protein